MDGLQAFVSVHWMQLLAEADSDSTALSYWLNWRVLVCAFWVFTSMVVASVLIWKYERSNNSEPDGQSSRVTRNDELWKPCLKEIHPIFLTSYRIIAFCLLFVSLSIDVAVHGFELFFYYTQWTFALVTIYFAFGSLLSIHGCYHYLKRNNSNKCLLPEDMEQGLNVPLTQGVNSVNGNRLRLSERLGYCGKSDPQQTYGTWAYLFQVLYQMTAGAATLTDFVYWCFIFPFMTLRDYEMNFLTVLSHSLNIVLLLGDTALNCLPFPWFRMSYFIMWTAIYVVFQWIIHACVSLWWPYPFLDLSKPSSPVWYLIVALMHLPCYGLYMLVVRVKHMVLSRWFPHSYIHKIRETNAHCVSCSTIHP